MKGISIAGRKRNDGIDFYQTPPQATKAILEREKLEGTILEPCCGAGAISGLIPNCVATDIRFGKDIFSYENSSFDNVITNPPYRLGQEIVEKSLKIARKKVLLLLKLSFLESAKRYEMFVNSPLKTVYVFCKRVQMYPEGQPKPKNSGTIAYAWYVWDKNYTGKPFIEWIRNH
jgi:hypothetical protein